MASPKACSILGELYKTADSDYTNINRSAVSETLIIFGDSLKHNSDTQRNESKSISKLAIAISSVVNRELI